MIDTHFYNCFLMKLNPSKYTNNYNYFIRNKVKIQMKEQRAQQNAKSQKIIKSVHSDRIKRKETDKNNVLNQSQMALSTISAKHKIPQVIQKYIVQQAKQSRKQKKAMKTAQKLTGLATFIVSKKKDKKQILATSTCTICEMEVPETEMVSMSECDHKFCASCLHQYIIYKISRFEQVECPFQNCNKLLDENSNCYKQLPLDARKKYKKLKQYIQTLKDPNIKLCPNQQCDGYLKVEKPQMQGVVLVIANPTCTKCKKKFCDKCLFEEHYGQCDDHQLTFFQNTLQYRQCTKCKNVIQKSSGCNHMTCRCGYQFCYVCGGKWSSSHLCNNPDQQPLFIQPGCCQCECCNCQCGCCDCECCDSFCDCVGGALECLCTPCAACWDCCESTNCFCQSSCCDILLKFLFAILWLTVLLPLFMFQLLFVIVFRTIIGILFGLFAFPCLLQQNNISVQCQHVVIGILLLPFTMLFLMGLGIKTMFVDEGCEQIHQIACMPFEIFSSIVCQN